MIWRSSPGPACFLEKGIPAREFFPHRAAVIRKQYPDTFVLLEGLGMSARDLLSCEVLQLNLYSDHLAGFPDHLFTNSTVNWHGQQLAQKGLVAAAAIWIEDASVFVCLMQSDLCQQVYRHAELKKQCITQLKKRFSAWYKLLFNAILDFAFEAGAAAVLSPTAEWIVGATKKQVDPALFHRIYNFPGESYAARRVTRGCAKYWEVPLDANTGRVVRLQPCAGPETDPRPLISILHDTEENIDTDVPADECRRNLTAMLKIEKELGVRATYNVVGNRFASKRDEIRASGAHSLAFHSWDHDLENQDQLRCCRKVDLQVRGYRPPRSVIPAELSDYALSYHNFEWLASSYSTLKSCPGIAPNRCGLENGIVRIPVSTDDYPLFMGQLDYDEWSSRLLRRAGEGGLLCFGLHDCYARCWLDRYPELLEALSRIGRFVTADELCDMTFLSLG